MSWPPTWATAPMTRARPRRICCAAPWPACRSGHGLRAGWRCAPTPATSPGSWPAPPTTSTSASRSAPSGSRRCGGCWPGSPRTTGTTRPAWTAPRSRSRSTARTGGRRTRRLLVRRVLLDPAQVSADPRSRRRRTLHPDQRALPFPELARAGAIYAYSFILTSLDVSSPDKAIAAEHWYRHRTTVENIFRDSKLGAALRHLPSGYPQVNLAWMWGALLAASMAAWLHQLTAITAGQDILAGHGVRGGKAMIATLRWRLIAVPGRLIRHARHLTLRLPPGHGLLPEVLARLRDLPAPA